MRIILILLTYLTLQAQDTLRPSNYDMGGVYTNHLLLNKNQITEIYKGLKQGEKYRDLYKISLNAVDSLVNIIQEQDYNLNLYIEQNNAYDEKLKTLNEQLTKAVVVEDKNKWYNSRWIWAGVGFAGGVYFNSKIK